MGAGEDKTVKYVEQERKQQAKWKNKKDLSIEQPRSNAYMEARISAMISEMASAMNAVIRSLAMCANSMPSGLGRNWQAMSAPNAKIRTVESQLRKRVVSFQCALEAITENTTKLVDREASETGVKMGTVPVNSNK